ncbi:MAG: Limonene 1,2-monooxygenase [Alphaproteobacteria bacterium MarineAlpha11_Bin1]|nr:MAG: Limonene 1,2-monooxygenase [Alphaproteobacteria bacterium MarineAlpha11_Bin1]
MNLSLFYLPMWREGYGTTLTDYYEELTETIKLVDQLGWARALTTEHHFHYYGGAVPNPAIILAAWARETTNIRLAPAVSLMQLRDPLKVAEDYALVDQLSGGRVDMGVAKGFVPHEFQAFHIDQAEVQKRISEGLEICKKFWVGEAFEYMGEYFSFDRLQPWPPAVNGALPIWNAASNSQESFVNAAETGYHLMMNHYPMSADAVAQKFRWYCDSWERAGRNPSNRKAMIAFMTHIADTEEQAIEEAKAALQEHAGAFGKVMRGEQWDNNWAGDISVLIDMCENDDWRDVFRRRTLICSPEQAAERIQHYIDLGFTEISFIARYAGLKHDQTMNTIRRISEEVMPMLGVFSDAAE